MQGRALLNAVGNLDLMGAYGEALKKLGHDLENVASQVGYFGCIIDLKLFCVYPDVIFAAIFCYFWCNRSQMLLLEMGAWVVLLLVFWILWLL